ncbi:hypothetical protein BGZ61DRAFT_377072 [Ilyonectria robusta]|uniref:uncharacterized protein n=1 Tax=Ilyonectria robusta TaxID=1079257 RepID=UPI001E8D9DB7|nr:uncharacterized protein BGZ61DRAFT_377072 [Ilyonectria robusta]KAH8645893.1 hypothetical protein BGZ61DRAFT_377072 [Ilyonectria robusta]
MAEVLGIAAAAAQFAGLALKIAKTGKDIYDQLQNVPEQVPKWLQQIDGLRAIVSNIESCPELQTPEVGFLMRSCLSTSQQLHGTLDELHFSANDPLVQRTWRAVIGKTKETELRNFFEELERIKSALTLEIGVENLNQQRQIRSDIQELKISNQAESDEDQCLRSLFVTDPTRDREDMIDAKGEICAGTCEWITSTQEFNKWYQQAPHLLWISAPPGMGKTYISIYLSRHLERFAAQSDTLVLFFFCDNKVASRNTAMNILRGLLYQLVMHQNDLIHIMMPLWKIQSSNLFQGNSLNTLWKFFEEMVNKIQAKTVHCIIDALDECEESSLANLLRKFEMLSRSPNTSTSKMKLICLSRRYPENIPAALSSFSTLKLDLIPAGKEDTRRFISQRVSQLAQKKPINSNLQLHIQQSFEERSEGTFLWISFMAQDLERKSIEEIESSLKLLPQGLDAVYERILSHIKPDKMEILSKMIDWIRVAVRPLRVPELCEAVGLEATGLLSREQVCIALIKSCGHLLQTTKNPEMVWSDERTFPWTIDPLRNHMLDYWLLEVTFLHQSAKDYFTKSNHMTGSKCQAGLTKRLHGAISSQLTMYLSDREACIERWNDKIFAVESPLFTYARRHWSDHFRELDEVSGLIERNPRFFGKDSAIRNEALYFSYDRSHDLPTIPLLHMACILGLKNLAKWCLHRRQVRNRVGFMSDLTTRWGGFYKGYGCPPLHYAYRHRREDIAKLLLDAGADPGAVSDDHDPIFVVALQLCGPNAWHQLAATKGGKKCLDPRNQPLRVLRDLVAFKGEDACRFLIEEHGWDVNLGDPLIWTLKRSNLELARTFVSEWHACIDDHWGLLEAIVPMEDTHEFQGAINLLEEWSVDMNATDEDGCTLLFRIIGSADYSPVDIWTSKLDMALRAGVDPRKPNFSGQIPLHFAASSKFFSGFISGSNAIKIILHNGQSLINVVCGAGQTSLHHFVSTIVSIGRSKYCLRQEFVAFLKGGPASLVRLLDLGVDRHIRDQHGNTALDLLRPALGRDLSEDKIDFHEVFTVDLIVGYRLMVEKSITILESYAPVWSVEVGRREQNDWDRARR